MNGGGGRTYKPAGVVLQSVRFPEFFAKTGAFHAMGFGEQWRSCGLTVPCLRSLAFKEIKDFVGVAVELLWLV